MFILCQLATDAHFSILLLPYFSLSISLLLYGVGQFGKIARIFKNTLLKIKSRFSTKLVLRNKHFLANGCEYIHTAYLR